MAARQPPPRGPMPPTPRSPAAIIASRSQAHRPHLPRRQSRFTEDMTEEYSGTPTHSLYEHEGSPSMVTVSAVSARSVSGGTTTGPSGVGEGYSPSTNAGTVGVVRDYRPLELILRGMNGCSHGAACVILVAIMVEFLTQWEGVWLGHMSAQAIALLVFLGMDTLLDIISLIRLPKRWPVWGLCVRLMNGVVYIAMFMVYVAHARVFPQGFTFWGMEPGFAGPVVYMFLWLLGIWNLCHITLRRRRLGEKMRSVLASSSRSRGSDRRSSLAGESSPRSRMPLWRRWVRIGEHEGPQVREDDIEVNRHSLGRTTVTTVAVSPPISLRERPAGMKRPSFTATTRTASSHSVSGKADERGVSRYDSAEKETAGGLSPPPPVRTKGMKGMDLDVKM